MTLASEASAIPLEHIEGKYEILEKMREGGMGAVYKVRHRLLDEVRVIKMMRPHLARDETLRARFVREAKMAIRLRHRNLAQLYDFTVDDEGYAFIVMEYIEGPTLVELIKILGRPSLGLALEIIGQSLEVIGYLHRKQVIHRDISPDNLILTRDEDRRPLVKLIDLGIAKAAQNEDNLDLTATGTFIGKIRYSSPEHFRAREGSDVDARSDLYSLGIVIYELLTGRYPIKGKGTSSLIAGHLMHPPLAFDKSDPDRRLDDELRGIVLRLLEKEPEKRFASAQDCLAALSGHRTSHKPAEDELVRLFEMPIQATQKMAVIKPGSTQEHLDRQFGMEATVAPPPVPTAVDAEGAAAAPSAARVQQVKALLLGAGKLLEARHYDEARLQLTSVLELDPSNAEANRLLSTVDEADEKLQRRRREAADEVDVLITAGNLDGAGEALEAALTRHGPAQVFDDLEVRLEAARAEREGREAVVGELRNKATQALADGDPGTALEAVGEAIELDPSNEALHEMQQQAEEQHRQQLEQQRRAKEIAATAEAIAANLEREELDEAQRALEVAEKLYGREESLVTLRRRYDRMTGELAQRSAEALRARAAELSQEERFEEAVEQLQEALRIVPQHMMTMRALAAAKKALQRQEEERRRAAVLTEQASGAERLVVAGRFESAVRRLDELVAEHGEFDEAARLRAMAESEAADSRKRQQTAFALLEKAREAAEKARFAQAREHLDGARPFVGEFLEVRELVSETEAAVTRQQDEHRKNQEAADAAAIIRAHIERGELKQARHQLEVAERLYAGREVLAAVADELAAAQQREREAQVEELLQEAADQELGFDEVMTILERALELDPGNDGVLARIEEARAGNRKLEAEQRAAAVAEVMAEVDELVLGGDFKAALDRLAKAVKRLGDFKEAYAARHRLEAAQAAPPPLPEAGAPAVKGRR